MGCPSDVNVFLNPQSVAVIGATERPGAWGRFIMEGLKSADYPGIIYPVNRQTRRIFNLPGFSDIRHIKGPVDLAVISIPDKTLEETIMACGEKKVKGITIITSGFAESSEKGRQFQERLTRLARSLNIRLLGPNVSGTFNLHSGFNASSIHSGNVLRTPITAICQGGFAIHDLLASARHMKMGIGKFVHTGNEADLSVTDFLEFFEKDPETRAIVMYLESIRDGRRFMDVARRVNRVKPIITYKGGRTADSSRAAQSHTGALSSEWRIVKGMLKQTGIVVSPAMELLLPLAHGLIERPRMKGTRIGIITMGGSWGVSLADCLVESGLTVPELSHDLQGKLRDLGLPPRASSKNPIDFGASGKFSETDFLLSLGRKVIQSGEVQEWSRRTRKQQGCLARWKRDRSWVFPILKRRPGFRFLSGIITAPGRAGPSAS
jgi:acyl-CoA synthetase (NDP forming)